MKTKVENEVPFLKVRARLVPHMRPGERKVIHFTESERAILRKKPKSLVAPVPQVIRPDSPTPKPAAMSRDRNLRADQAALFLNCSSRHIYQLCAQGHLLFFFLGVGRRGLRIKLSSLEDFERRRLAVAGAEFGIFEKE